VVEVAMLIVWLVRPSELPLSVVSASAAVEEVGLVGFRLGVLVEAGIFGGGFLGGGWPARSR